MFTVYPNDFSLIKALTSYIVLCWLFFPIKYVTIISVHISELFRIAVIEESTSSVEPITKRKSKDL